MTHAVTAPSEARLARCASLLVRTGAALQRGQELVVRAPVERADFAQGIPMVKTAL